MKRLSERRALEKLQKLKDDFTREIKYNYEHKAKNCLTCETQGTCCQDAHFVNIRITRPEAEAIKKALAKLPGKQAEIAQRINETIRNLSAFQFRRHIFQNVRLSAF